MMHHPKGYRQAMRPQQSCCGAKPPKPAGPCKPEKHESVLLPKIVCCERRNIPRHCTELALEGIPCHASAPYRLCGLRQSGAQPWWRPLDAGGNHQRMRIAVCIPVCAEIKDSCGRCYHASGVVEVEVSVGARCMPCDGWKQQLFIVPALRLLKGEECSEDACFRVEVEVQLEIYLLKPEACMVKKGEPPCPDVPLYPRPCGESCGCHENGPYRPWIN